MLNLGLFFGSVLFYKIALVITVIVIVLGYIHFYFKIVRLNNDLELFKSHAKRCEKQVTLLAKVVCTLNGGAAWVECYVYVQFDPFLRALTAPIQKERRVLMTEKPTFPMVQEDTHAVDSPIVINSMFDASVIPIGLILKYDLPGQGYQDLTLFGRTYAVPDEVYALLSQEE